MGDNYQRTTDYRIEYLFEWIMIDEQCILEGVGMAEAAAECSRFNLRQNPDSGEMMLGAARAEVLAGNLGDGKRLLVEARSAPEERPDDDAIGWLEDYITALEAPVRLDEPRMRAIAGDYGPRHIVIVDGGLAYRRDGTGVAAPRPLRAIAPDTFMIVGVPDFKLRVDFDGSGRPTRLVGLYPGGGTDESPRD